MSKPARHDLDMYQGDPWALKLVFKDKATGNPISRVGWTYRGVVKRTTLDEDPVAMAVDMTDAVDGEVVLSLTEEQTQDLSRHCIWDLEEEGPDPVLPRTLIAGAVTVGREVGA